MKHKNGTTGGHHGRSFPAEKMIPLEYRPSRPRRVWLFLGTGPWMLEDMSTLTRQEMKQRHKKKARAFHRELTREAMWRVPLNGRQLGLNPRVA